jgi:hypothetical protein
MRRLLAVTVALALTVTALSASARHSSVKE